MNPGEYIGKDGRKYRWKHERLSDNSAEGYDHQAHVHEWETEWIDPADWDDAKAALDELIEAESTKVLEPKIKGANMRPGEYEVNGIRYGWAHDLDVYEHRERIDGAWFRCARFPDIEKAEKARHELAEAESVEWVEIDDNARIQADGSDPQVRHGGGICVWRGLTNPIDKRWPKAYRKGREVAESEQADLRDAVRELVEAVNIYDRYLKRHGSASRNDLIIAAKKVEAKL